MSPVFVLDKWISGYYRRVTMVERSTFQPSGSGRRPKPPTSLHPNSRNALERARDVVRGKALGATAVLGGGRKALLTPAGMAGAAVELAWAGTHLALYPFGLLGGSDGHGGPVQH
jgi:hypothetical protein